MFEDKRNGSFKVISFFAKRARGAMPRYALRKQLQDPAKLKLFKEDGYRYAREASSADRWVFRRL